MSTLQETLLIALVLLILASQVIAWQVITQREEREAAEAKARLQEDRERLHDQARRWSDRRNARA